MRALFGLAGMLCLLPAAWSGTATPVTVSKVGKVETVETPRPLAPGDALAGRQKSYDERCQECHARDGMATEIGDGESGVGKFPRLAGQPYAYLVKQLHDFRSGRRRHDTMEIMAKSLEEADLRDIAAYFASLPPMRGSTPVRHAAAHVLFTAGDTQRGIPACQGCHVATPASGNDPLIVGQHERYLHKQLLDWKQGERRNSPGGIMNSIAELLSDHELDALAAYLSAQ